MPEFDAIGIIATDLPATLDFWRLVGLDVPDQGDGHVEVPLNAATRLMFDTVEVMESFSTYEPAAGGRNVGLAFRCADPGEVDDTHARVVAGGHRSHVDPFDAPWGQRYATVLDPDGNPVDFYAPLDQAD